MSENSTSQTKMSQVEFVALMAFCVSLTALSIDAMLPALGIIASDLSLTDPNDAQLVVGIQFAGMTIGQALAGPLSDSWGRKRAMYGGLLVFSIGSLLAMTASNFTVLLFGRALQGAGASAPRVVSNAIVRDQYEGRPMARVLSLIATVFIIVPVIAPLVGQGILAVATWRTIFGFLLFQGLFAFLWFAWRQKETLPANLRIPFSLSQIGNAAGETMKTKISFGYMLVAGLSSGGFIGYLSSSLQILQDQYGVGDLFPLYFAVLALSVGTASLCNAKLVLRMGMTKLCIAAQTALTVTSIVFLFTAFAFKGHPPLWLLMSFFMIVFFCLGILFGNCTARAMEPLGHIAGTASAVFAAVTTLISSGFGILIGRAYDGTIIPLVAGFAILGVIAQAVLRWTERNPEAS